MGVFRRPSRVPYLLQPMRGFVPGKEPTPHVLEGASTLTVVSTGSLTTSIQLNAAASLATTSTGSLSTSILLVGAASVVITSSGDLSTSVLLSGSADLTVSSAADLTTDILLAADAALAVTSTADLSTEILLEGASNLAVTSTADLQLGTELYGSSDLAVATTGELTTEIQLVSDATLSLASTGDLSTEIQLAAAASVTVSSTGDLDALMQIEGAAALAVTSTADLATSQPIEGSASLSVSSDGVLTTAIQLVAAASLSVTSTASLTTAIQLVAAANLSVSSTAALTARILFTGTASLAVSSTADLDISKQLVGTSHLAVTSAGTLDTAVLLSAAAGLSLTSTGILSVPKPLGGAAALATTSTGELSTEVNLLGASLLTVVSSGSLTTGIPLLGSANLTVSSDASLSTEVRLAATALLTTTATAQLTTQVNLVAAAAVSVSSAGALTTNVRLQGTAGLAVTSTGTLDTDIAMSGSATLQVSSTAKLTANGPAYITHPHGRQPIGVDQPPSGGSMYPLVFTETGGDTSIQKLFGDFYLSYPDDTCSFQTPFSIAWLFGFGANQTAAPGWTPEPIHDYDLIIKDATGAVVFDSTQALSYFVKNWGSRLRIIEWKDDENNAVCRCTVHTAWTAEDIDSGSYQLYDTNIEPTNAVLDARTYNRLPLRVSSLRVGLTKLTGKITLESGYNVRMFVTTPEATTDLTLDDLDSSTTLIPGTRASHQMTIQANPGDGLGQVPGCEAVEPVIKIFGGARPDSAGNINLDFEDCLRTQRPVGLVNESPREFRYLSNTLTQTNARAALEVHNDCGPCCECDFYVRTYTGLKRQWNLWYGLAQRTEAVRDVIQLNKDRWLLQKACRETNPLRLILLAEPDCKVTGGAIFCNTSKCCLQPFILRFTFECYDGPTLITDPGFAPASCLVMQEGSPQRNGEERVVWSGTWPVFEVAFDYADPQATSRVSFRMCLPSCADNQSIKMTVAAYAIDGGECLFAAQPVPDPIQTLWEGSSLPLPSVAMRGLLTSKLVPLRSASAYCTACEC